MAAAEAIRSKETLKLITELLQQRYKRIYQDAFNLNMCVALRSCDLLNLPYSMLTKPDGTANDYLTIKEQKTRNVAGKLKRKIKLTNKAKAIIEARRKDYPSHTYLFESESNRSKGKPLTYKSLYRMFVDIADRVEGRTGEVIQFTTHSCRKTLGYMLYMNGVTIEKISELLHHNDTSVTLRYIGIVQQDIDECYDMMEEMLDD